MQRDSRGHYPQGSVLAEGNLQKAARAKVSGVREDLPAGLPGGPLPPRGPAQSQHPVWFSAPSPGSSVPPASVVPAVSLARCGAEGGDLCAPGAGTPASRFAHRAPRAGGAGLRAHAQRLTEARKEGREVQLRFLREAAAATTATRPALAPCTRCNAQTVLLGGAGGGGGGRRGEFSAMNLRGLFQDFNPR